MCVDVSWLPHNVREAFRLRDALHFTSQVTIPSIFGQHMPYLKIKNIRTEKKNKGKTLNKQIVIYNKKINLMKIDFTYGRKFS